MDTIDHRLAAWTATFEADALMARLQAVGVPAGVAQTAADLFADPQLAHRGHFAELQHPEIGDHVVPGPGFQISDVPRLSEAPAPCLAEHTATICTEMLGMSDAELLALMQAGILE